MLVLIFVTVFHVERYVGERRKGDENMKRIKEGNKK
jgi:hypothetical protein